ncbi:MAG: (2Fe-2S)-binding protein [Acidobacteriota bacterium]|jgi:aerobic-type carbon monoxide dehydrogenase small subunit (CoxS/CutS family)|nr:(2Fe-2S)-binding protein [Acidobacteriota bacterium]
MPDEPNFGDEGNKGAENAGKMSRRNFLKDAGLAAGAPAVLGGAMAISAPPDAEAAQPYNARAVPVASEAVCASGMATVTLTVNGDKYTQAVEPHWTLRQLLRDRLGFTSPKDWCGGMGACGSCTVIMNGRPVLSCMTLACECGGAVVETAEGIAKAGHPLIQAYIDHNAFQCGYCTPGFVVSAKALLDRNADPTEEDVRDALGGNLCRCATYQQHPPAVLQAAKALPEFQKRSGGEPKPSKGARA